MNEEGKQVAAQKADELGLLYEEEFVGHDKVCPRRVKVRDREEWIDKEFGATSLSARDAAMLWLDGFEQGQLSSDDAHWRAPQQEATLDGEN